VNLKSYELNTAEERAAAVMAKMIDEGKKKNNILRYAHAVTDATTIHVIDFYKFIAFTLDGVNCGYICYTKKTTPDCSVRIIHAYVMRQFRKKGIGSEMVSYVTSRNSDVTLAIESKELKRFYFRLGFTYWIKSKGRIADEHKILGIKKDDALSGATSKQAMSKPYYHVDLDAHAAFFAEQARLLIDTAERFIR